MKIIEGGSLKSYNTFGIDVRVKRLIEVESESEIEQVFQKNSTPQPLILGGGSNTLFTQDYTHTIIKIGSKGIDHRETQHFFEVRASAGEAWNDLVLYCLKYNIAGLENLSLIPGTVGAAPVQNIGAYGVELKDSFYKLKAYSLPTHQWNWFTRQECEFSYRNSVFKAKLRKQFIISEVYFRFSKNLPLVTDYGSIAQELEKERIDHPNMHDISRIVTRIRQEKLPDPQTIGNAGSFFKNPIISHDQLNTLKIQFPDIIYYPFLEDYKVGAGWMIEKCGWKGKKIKNVGTWKNQALVLVNFGGASGMEVLDFAEKIIESVWQTFHLRIEPEVNII